MIEELEGDKISEAVDSYVVLYMKEIGKYVGKVLWVDEEKCLMRYEVMSGPNKGHERTGRYKPNRPYKRYDEESLVKAFFEK